MFKIVSKLRKFNPHKSVSQYTDKKDAGFPYIAANLVTEKFCVAAFGEKVLIIVSSTRTYRMISNTNGGHYWKNNWRSTQLDFVNSWWDMVISKK